MWVAPSYIDVPMPALSAAAMALFATKLFKTLLLYPPKVGSGFRGALWPRWRGFRSPIRWARRCGRGCSRRDKPFLRTPKCADPAQFSQVLRVVWQETMLLALLLAAMVSMGFDRGFEDPARQALDGDAGGAEPALLGHHGDGADFRPFQPDHGDVAAKSPQAAGGGLTDCHPRRATCEARSEGVRRS